MGRNAAADSINEEQKHKFAQWLTEQRKLLRLTQDEMSHKLGMSKSYYNTIENERRTPTDRLMLDAAEKLGDFTIIKEVFGETAAEMLAAERGIDRELINGNVMDSGQLMPMNGTSIEKQRLIDDTANYLVAGNLENVKLVEASDVLKWWGYEQDQMAFVRPLKSLDEIEHEALLYFSNEESNQSLYAFADLTDRFKPSACPLELQIRQQYKLSWDDMERWGLDSRRAIEQIPLSFSNFGEQWFLVIGFVSRPIKQKAATRMTPNFKYLSDGSRKQLIENTFHLFDLEKKVGSISEPRKVQFHNEHGLNQM